MHRASVTAVVVNYNTRVHLSKCLQSLESGLCTGEIDRIIVVDCNSSDGSAEHVLEFFPGVELLSVENRGYGAGANAGMAQASSDFILLLNADTEVSRAAVDALRKFLEYDPCTAIVGPRLYYRDGSAQPTRRRFPARMTPVFESTFFHELLPANRWVNDYYVADRPDEQEQYVDWVVGAALMVRRIAVDRVGGFDETFRMFAEEIEWCYRMQRHGWRTAYLPAATVLHHEGASTRQSVAQRQIEFDTSRIELQRRLHGSLNAHIVRRSIQISYLLHILREGTKWILGHRRPLRAERIRLYRTALVSGLNRARNDRR